MTADHSRATGLDASVLDSEQVPAEGRVDSSSSGGRRAPWWGEVLVIVWLCWIYDAVNNLAPMRHGLAYTHAREIFDIESFLHLDLEPALDRWLDHHHTLALIISNYYDNAHFVVTFALVGYLWWKAPALYRPLRTGLVLINVVGMLVFWTFPTAPPRLYAPQMFSDVVANTHAFGSWHSGTLSSAGNQFAAMPSLHMAWACWSALAAWRILRQRGGQDRACPEDFAALYGGTRFRGSSWAGLVWVYPAVTTVAVLATGNHFVLDVIAGVVTFVVATVAADRWQSWWTTAQAVVVVRLRER